MLTDGATMGGVRMSFFLTCMYLVVALCSVWARVHWSSLPSLRPPSGQWSPCGSLNTSRQGALCRCLQHVADCTDRNLTEIPRFDRPVDKLLFAFNRLDNFSNTETAATITHLDISDNGANSLLDQHLSAFVQLRVLDISRNGKAYDMPSVFRLSTLEELAVSRGLTKQYFSFTGRDFLPPTVLLPNLQVLHMNYYTVLATRVINMTLFGVFPKLRELHFKGSPVDEPSQSVFVPFYLPYLETLDLSDHKINSFDTCSISVTPSIDPIPTSSPYFPKLSYLDLSRNNLASWNTYPVCLPELKSLLLDYNPLLNVRLTSFHMPKLKRLSLRAAAALLHIDPDLCESRSLRSLDLSQNSEIFAPKEMDTFLDSILHRLPNLTTFNLEGNDLHGVSQDRFRRLFAGPRSLRHVSLGNTKLDKVDTVLGQHLNNVTHLFLHDNLISEIPSGAFDELHELRVLRLDGNQMSWLSQSSFSHHTRARLTSLNLSHNPWQCTCALLWLRNWIEQQPELFDYHNPFSSYECRNLPGRDVVTFLHNEQPCLLGHDANVLTVALTALLMSALTVAALLYRFRWHVRLLLYEVFRGKSEARRPRAGGGDLQYDLFVSYDSEDSHWVLYTFVPRLEQQMGLRVCVHQRDFIPGKNIVDNILHCLEDSKRVLAVFSPSFADSPWCHFELEMCLSHVIDNNDVMVVVMLRHVPSRDMSGAMLALINTTTYIEWGEHPDVRDSFWRRMTLALKDILPGVRH